MMVTLDDKGQVRVLDRGAAPSWRHLGTHANKVDNLQLSPRRTYAVTVSYDRTIRLMATQPKPGHDGPEVRILDGHDDAIYRVAFSADERVMVSAGDDATARVWDVESAHSRPLRGHDDDVYSVALSPSGDLVASVSLDSTVRVWPAMVESSTVLSRSREAVSAVEFASNEELLTQSYEGGILVRNVATGAARRLAESGEPAWVPRRLELSTDRRRGATIVGKAAVLIWDLKAHESFALRSEFGKARAVHFSPDGARAIVAYPAGVVAEWDLETRTPSVLVKGDAPVDAIYAPDGREVAVAYKGGVTRWDLAQQKVVGEHAILGGDEEVSPDLVRYSPDGRWLALISRRGYITLLHRRDGRVRALHAGEDKFTSVEFSPDGGSIAAGASDRQIRVWDTETGALRIVGSHSDLVMRVAFSPDSTMLASSSYDKTVRLWDLASGKTRILRGHVASVDTIAFSPDGQVLASGSRDGSVRLWAVASAFAGGTPAVIRARMSELTTAVITATDRPETVR
jgi:WD40 repeat protein